MRVTIIVILIFIGIPATIGIYNWNHFQGKFVINQSHIKDEINFETGGKFIRIYSLDDSLITEKGEWYFRDNHIYLTNWSNQIGLLRIPVKETITAAFTCSRNLLMRPQEIYIDHTKEVYYHKSE